MIGSTIRSVLILVNWFSLIEVNYVDMSSFQSAGENSLEV